MARGSRWNASISARLTPPGLVFLVGLLAACGVVTSPAYVDPAYQPSLLSYVTKHGPLYTQIIGSPFGEDSEGLADVVLTALEEGQFSGRQIEFSTERADPPVSPYFVVVLFNPAPSANPGKICGEPIQPQRPAEPGRARVMMAFCNGDVRVSSVSGTAWDVTAPDSPNLAHLIRQGAADIFSTRSIDSRGEPDEFDF